jgi:hypothetical protein
MTFGTVFGSTAQIGLLSVLEHTPKEKSPGVAVKLRA